MITEKELRLCVKSNFTQNNKWDTKKLSQDNRDLLQELYNIKRMQYIYDEYPDEFNNVLINTSIEGLIHYRNIICKEQFVDNSLRIMDLNTSIKIIEAINSMIKQKER